MHHFILQDALHQGFQLGVHLFTGGALHFQSEWALLFILGNAF